MQENNVINTIIQLRHDTESNWKDGQSTSLMAGEVAVEIGENGKAKIKIGDGEKTFGELDYFAPEAQVFQSENIAYDNEENDNEIISKLVGNSIVVNGDCAIIKRQIAKDSETYLYTSYVYTDGAWAAMDGNYSADTVFTKNDITLTSAVGNYTKNYKINAGTSLETVLSGLFQKEEEPGTPSKPTASISVSGSNGEVGSEYTVPTANLSIGGVGSYTYGPATGIVFNAGDIKLAEGAEPSTASNYVTNDAKVSAKTDNLLSLKATGDKVKYVDGDTKYTFSGSASYQAATKAPVTNLGNPSKTQSAISAGSCTIEDKTATFTGWRRMFMGAVSKNAEINSDTIKGITEIKGQASKSTQEFTASVGTEKILIAFPRNISTKAPKVQYFTMSWEDFGDFSLVEEKVQVADAAGALTTNDNYKYMVYAYTPADPLKADTKFKVTLQ